LQNAGANVQDGVEVEVTPDISYGGEGLNFVKGKTFVKSGVLRTEADAQSLVQ